MVRSVNLYDLEMAYLLQTFTICFCSGRLLDGDGLGAKKGCLSELNGLNGLIVVSFSGKL